jgi:hypothetical protein
MSRMLGVQTAKLEAIRDCDQSVQRPGVRTRAMCRRQAETEENSLKNQNTEGDSGPKRIGKTAQVHHSTQKRMAFIALEWCYQNLRESGRGKTQVQ